jgi:hypothetical protein
MWNLQEMHDEIRYGHAIICNNWFLIFISHDRVVTDRIFGLKEIVNVYFQNIHILNYWSVQRTTLCSEMI